MGELKMDNLEKGEVVLVEEEVVWQREKGRWSARRRMGELSRIILCVAFLILNWHYNHKSWYKLFFGEAIVTIEVEGVPQFVLDYAPLTYLDIAEEFFPSDIAAQISNTHPAIHTTAIPSPPALNISNLDILNKYGHGGKRVFLTSDYDVRTYPSFLTGIVPNTTTHRTDHIISSTIIVVQKPDNITDAFYMYFYAYNQGNTVLGHELGDHIGDWEHNMVRFVNGTPTAVWFSQHGNGEAFIYDVLEKKGKRPVNYSARGSHANYAVVGSHDHTIPNLNLPAGFILDYTSKGTLWDPTLSAYYYTWSETKGFEGINGAPEGAMRYKGRWGDDQYPDEDERQPEPWWGFRKYTSGPTGPWDKGLDRGTVCPENGIFCLIRERLGP